MVIPSPSWAKSITFKDLTNAVDAEEWDKVIELAKVLSNESKPIAEIDEIPYFIEYARFQILVQYQDINEHYVFLQDYPNSPYKERVLNAIAYLEFEEITKYPTVEKLKQFQQSHSTSILKAEAEYLEEDLAWQTILPTESIEKYRLFQERYPSGLYAPLAKEKEASLIYRQVREADTISTYMEFIEKYPDSHFSNEARGRTIELVWKDTIKDHTITGYQYFQQLYPKSKYADIAHKNEKELRWNKVQKEHNIQTYRNFELDFPASEESRIAEKREWDLYEYTRPSYPGEMTPKITRIRRKDDGRYRLFLDIVDDSGEFVGGLNNTNFTIYDAGYKVEDFEVEGMEQNRSLDVVFVLDTTGSMNEEINGVKEGIIRFSEIMQLRNRDVRYALITYGDTIRETHPFTKNVYTFQEWVSQKIADGGNDEPENSLEAIASGLKSNFNEEAQRIVVLITDASSHVKNYATHYDFAAINKLALKKDTQIYITGPNLDDYKNLSTNTAGVFYELDRTNFAEKMEEITQRLSKQYKLTYLRPPFAPPVMDELLVKIRVKPEFLLINTSAESSKGTGQKLVHASHTDANDMYRILDNNKLLCTNDGGEHWHTCGSGLPEERSLINLKTDKSLADIVWVNDDSGALWKSTDEGASFVPITIAADIVNIDAAEGGGLLVAKTKSLQHFTPDEKFVPLHTVADDKIVVGLTSIPKRKNEQLLSLSTGQLIHVTDTATSIYNGPCDSPSQLYPHPSREYTLLSICQNQLHRSIDLGRHWNEVAIPPHPEGSDYILMDLNLDPSLEQNNILTTSHGILRSNDLGMSWNWDRREIEETTVNLLTRTNQSKVIFADRVSDAIFSMDPVENIEFLSNTMFFDSGSAGPNEILHPHLNELAQQMISKPETHLTIEGHTDSYGTEEDNLTLSEARAIWIQRYLINKGVPSSRITTTWYGESRPIFDNATKEGRSKNRRVELIITNPS